MGFDAGDGVNYYAHPWSRTDSMTQIQDNTNVGLTGRYMYITTENGVLEFSKCI